MDIDKELTSARLVEDLVEGLQWSLRRIRERSVNNEQPLDLSCDLVGSQDQETGS